MSKQIENYLKCIKEFSDTYMDSDPVMGNVEQLTLINKSNIDEEITRGAARYAYIAALAENAKTDESLSKQEYEKARALVSQAIRQGKYEGSQGLKVTDKAIEEISEIDELVSTLKAAYNKKRGEAAVMMKIVDALSIKVDLLRTYASNARKEIDSLLNVKNGTLLSRVENNTKKEGSN